MARPTPFTRQTSFTQFSSEFPSKPQNGASLDAEFNAAKIALDETQASLARIQDDDGRLARGSVGRAQFDSSITLGFESPLPWTPDTAYTADLSTVFHEAKFYTCVETHTSSDTFDATKWFEVADLSASAAIEDGSVTEAKLALGAATADKIGPLAVTTPKIASKAVTNAKLADQAVTRSKVDDSAGPDLAALILPAGLGPLPWSLHGDAPTGWIFSGAEYNRADFPVLAALAVADAANTDSWFTVGDGSATFGIKPTNGLTLAGVDPDGSVIGAALALGATVGAKNVALSQANLPNVSFDVDIPGGQGEHAHDYDRPSQDPTGTSGFGTNPSPSGFGKIYPGTDTSTATLPSMSGTAASGGSGTAFSVVQPTAGIRHIFKAH